MLSTNILSRILPTRSTSRSIYEELCAQDNENRSDIELQAGLAIYEENFRFHDKNLSYPEVPGCQLHHKNNARTEFLSKTYGSSAAVSTSSGKDYMSPSKWMSQSPRLLADDGDDDVPASLLVEGNDMTGLAVTNMAQTNQTNLPKTPMMKNGSATRTQRLWDAPEIQTSSQESGNEAFRKTASNRRDFGLIFGNSRERALWRWINITNLDNFMSEVYNFYTGAGMWCILLEGALNLVQLVFVAIFTTFLINCVNFHEISTSRKLSEVVVPQCMKNISGLSNLAVWLFTLYVLWRIYQLLAKIPRLLRIREFYLHLLEIPEIDMQTITWQDIVARIMALRDANPVTAEGISSSNRRFLGSQSKQRLDAHDIANRLMRRENYLIALFNKDILDLTLPLPTIQGRQFFSRTLLWNIDQCIMDLVFNEKGQVRQMILKETYRKKLSDALRARFKFAAFMNAWLAPILVIYLMILYFLRYFNEYQKNPSAVGSRQFTPLAVWKLREFNELQHLFDKRLNMSHPFASRYLDQFPKNKTTQLARSISFFAGAIASVLALITLWDPEMLTNFEITADRPVVFYIGVFGAIWALTNGMIPEENLVFDPEYALRNVIDHIHYMPNHWQNRLHSDSVRREFASLYKLKITIFFEEVFSIIVTPFILWISLPKCSDQIIDFFREFTVHVDGVGYVCSFAVFDFKRGDNRKLKSRRAGGSDIRDNYYSTKHGKMSASYYGFIDNYLLNPKATSQCHIPTGIRQKYYPPPSFPGLLSPTLISEMQTSREGYNKRRSMSRTPRFKNSNTHITSPLQSILLDPHHQPLNSEFERPNPRHRYQNRENIMKELTEDDELEFTPKKKELALNQRISEAEQDESQWDSPLPKDLVDKADEDENNNIGVLGLLYQFQKVHKEGKGSVDI